MRVFVIVLVLSSARYASAEPLDVAAIAKRVESCALHKDDLDAIGPITDAQPLGVRSAKDAVQVQGKSGRAYVFFAGTEPCTVVPVFGKPAAAKGSFGNGAVVAYGLYRESCHEYCPTAISFKTAKDAVVDAVLLPEQCEEMTLDRLAVFDGHDSILAGCWSSAGADPGRADFLLESVKGRYEVVAMVPAGIAWYQIPGDGVKRCQARPPGGLIVTTVGTTPELVFVDVPTPDEAQAANIAMKSGGCERPCAASERCGTPRRAGSCARASRPSGSSTSSARADRCARALPSLRRTHDRHRRRSCA